MGVTEHYQRMRKGAMATIGQGWDTLADWRVAYQRVLKKVQEENALLRNETRRLMRSFRRQNQAAKDAWQRVLLAMRKAREQ